MLYAINKNDKQGDSKNDMATDMRWNVICKVKYFVFENYIVYEKQEIEQNYI